ncbi:HAAS signaling domain-containing protein [Eisenbergiella tayi]|uniref:HAAS signaling domain-containing protein n=1 Tax=Eisenbergiella tayi TaxID=1432052 RepID=UPI00242E9E1F|nr:DUF1700 domain-containing protein [Eisenbergiella tayi]
MNRQEFMKQLEMLLSDISQAEREEALQYYNDYLDDAGIENEEESIGSLGSPAQVAANIKEGLRDGIETGEFTEGGYHMNMEEEAPAAPEAAEESEASGNNSDRIVLQLGDDFSEDIFAKAFDEEKTAENNSSDTMETENREQESSGARADAFQEQGQDTSREPGQETAGRQQNGRYQENQYQNTQYQGNPGQGSQYQGNPGQGTQYQGNPSQGNQYQGNPNQGYQQGQPYQGSPYTNNNQGPYRNQYQNTYNQYQGQGSNQYQYQNQYGYSYDTYNRPPKKRRTAGEIILFVLLCIFALPIIVPIGIAVLAVIFSIAVAIIAVVASLVVAGFIVLAVGVVLVIEAFTKLFLFPAGAIYLLGGGLICTGIGLAMTAGMIWVAAKVVPVVCTAFVRACRWPFTRRNAA